MAGAELAAAGAEPAVAEEDVPTAECCICFDDVALAETIGCSGPDGHATCHECFSNYVAGEVEAGACSDDGADDDDDDAADIALIMMMTLLMTMLMTLIVMM